MASTRVIDLTHPLDERVPGFEKSSAKTVDKDGWNASTLSIYSHAGTHMDAPLHFDVSEQSIDNIPISRCMAEGILVDVRNAVPGMEIGIEHLGALADQNLKGKAILFHTGWSKYLGDIDMFRNHLPRIGSSLASFLVDKGVQIVGVEPPSVADVNNIQELKEVHHILLGGEIIIVEGLNNLEELSGDPFVFMALPLKIGKGDGAPVRAIAIETPLTEELLNEINE